LLRYIEQLLKERQTETTYWDLGEHPLIVAIPEYHKQPLDTPDERVRQFVQTIAASDGIVLGTPLYHGSYAGVLKNALDNLAGDAFRNKPVGLVSNAAGMRSSTVACDHLRPVVRALYGYALQSQIGTFGADYELKGEQYVLVNGEIQDRCKRLVDELILLADLFKRHEMKS
jgi:NAD(P)H-dependent FMN reductase